MKKVVLLAVLAGLAGWYFHFSRQLDEKLVNEYYDQQLLMLTEFDGQGLCATMAEGYRSTDVAFTPDGTKRTEMDSSQGCRDLEQELAQIQRLAHATQGILQPSYANRVQKVTFSEGDKLATVEGTVTIKMGEFLLGRTRYTEKLIRRNGKVKSLGGESKSWLYGGS